MYSETKVPTKNTASSLRMIIWIMRSTPSSPTTKPTRLAVIIITIFATAPTAQAYSYHHFLLIYASEIREASTIGARKVATSSGSINRVISQLQASSLRETSCHTATNVNAIKVFLILWSDPRSGAYRYLKEHESRIYTPDQPPIVGSMPAAPEPHYRVIVWHAPGHVFRRFYSIRHCP